MARTRRNENLKWENGDEKFRVLIEERRDRKGVFRVRYWFVGGNRKTFSFTSYEEAETAAINLWEQYLIKPAQTSLKSYKTISELSQWFYSRPELRPKTKRAYMQSLNEFIIWDKNPAWNRVFVTKRLLEHVGEFNTIGSGAIDVACRE